jgi:hypothetical protein
MGQLFLFGGSAKPQAAHWYDVDFWGLRVSLSLHTGVDLLDQKFE